MRTGKLLRGLSILSLFFLAAADFGQAPPPSPVPLISQVTPPSLSPASLTPGSNSFTLTILGANFAPGESVTLFGPGGATAIAPNPTVNATGTQMVANFANVSLPVPGTLTVTVTKRLNTGAVLESSNPYYLPVTPSAPTALLDAPLTSFLPGAPKAMATADFNGDGLPDLAVISQGPSGSNVVSILTGAYGGTFTAGASYTTGNAPSGIVAADFNGDRVTDLAVTNAMDNTVTIYLGNGDGTFRLGTTVSDPGVYPTQIVAADFNGDGKMDLAALNGCGTGQYGCYPTALPMGPGNVAILLGNGDGTFNVAPTLPTTGMAPAAIAAADLNADGFIDLIVANSSNNLTLLMGNGDGTFSAAANTPTTGFTGPPLGIAVGDFNGDGALDVAVSSCGDDGVTILLNKSCTGLPAAQCTLTPTAFGISLGVGTSPSAIAAADMNADGLIDLVVVNSTAGTVSVLLGDGTGGFAATGSLPSKSFPTGSSPQGLALIDFNQDGRLDAVTANQSGSYSVLRQAAVMQLQLTNSSSTFVYGYVPTLTVQLTTPPGAPAGPTGTVTLFDGATQVTSTALSGSQYQIQFVLPPGYFFGAGTHQLTAVYSGDTNFLAVTSNAVTEAVTTSGTTTTLSSDLANGPYGTSVTLTASIQPQTPAPSTGTVTFTDTTNSTTLGSATVSNNSAQLTLTNLAAGPHSILATYQGDSNCTGSSSSVILVTITQASTTTTVSASPNQAQFGQSVTFSAALQFNGSGTPTGTITFLDGSTSLGTVNLSNNAGSLSTSTLAVGSHVITAQYNGDSNFQGSSGTINEVVNTDATTTMVTSGTNPSSYGQAVVYSVSTSFVLSSLGTPAGLVTLYDGNTVLSSAYLSKGSAQFTVSSPTAGTHSITAQYAGTSNYAASTSAALTQTINPSATTLSVSASPNPSSVGQSVALQGTLQSTYGLISTGGTITFYNNGTQLGSVLVQANNISTQGSGYQIAFVTSNTAILPVGSQNITAKYSGDANLQASMGSMTQTVNPAPTNISIRANPGAPTYGQNVTFTATLSPTYGNTPTGTVTFSMNGTTLATASVTNSAAVFSTSTLSPGGHTIDAQYGGDANDASSINSVSITVAPPPTTTVLTSSMNPSYFNQPVVLVATPQSSVSGTPAGTMTFFDNLAMIGSSTLASGSAQLSISSLQVGTHSFTATYSGDFNFAGSTSAALSQVVNMGPTVTSVTSLDNPTTTPYNVRFLVTATATYGGTPSGTATLYDGSTVIGSGTLTSNPNGNTVELVVSGLTAGSHSITAKYSGSASFGASTSSALTQVMNLPGTTTSLSTATNHVAFGQSITLTASLVPGTQPQGSPLPSGTVTFFDGSTSLGNGTVANNSAQINVSSLAVGSHTLTAKYNGDSNYTGSTSSPFTETVNQASTTATVSSNANPAAFGQPVTFTASLVPVSGGSATGTITFLDGTNSLGSATVSNNSGQFTISSLTGGSHSVTAKYNGDANFTASTSSAITETINAAATTTAVIASLNPSVYGQSVSLTATVQPPSGSTATGTVTFFDGSNSLGTATLSSNSAQLAVSSLTTGSHSITAVYNGNSNLNASTSVVLTQTVSQASTTTTATANPNPSIFNQYVTFVIAVAPANGGSPTGTVTLLDGTNTLVSASLSGTGTAQVTYGGLAPGAHSITAVYAGDANFTGSTSAAVSQTVNQASSTTSVASNLNPSVYDQAVMLTATVQAPQGITPVGTMTFMDGSATLGSSSLSNGSAQLTLSGLAAGSHSITAVYAGNTYLTGSTSTGLAQSVNSASSATTVSSSANPVAFGQSVVFSATIQPTFGGGATGTVTFLDGAVTLGSSPVSGNAGQLSLSSLAVGSHSITAKYSGDTNVAGSTSATLTQTVSQATTTTTVTSGSNPAVFGQPVTFSVRIQSSSSGTPTGTVTLMDGSSSLGSTTLPANGVAQFAISSLAPGAHTISASYSGDASYAGSTSSVLTETVNPASSTVSIAVSPNPGAFGQAIILTASVTPSVSGDQATGAVTFFDGATSLGTANLSNNSAQLSLSNLAAGSHSITAQYAGDANFAGSTSAALMETINQVSTTTTLASNLNPATFGQVVTLTATVQAGSGISVAGTVTFLDGTLGLGTVTLANNSAQLTTSTLAPGTHTLTAVYNSNGNFAGSTSAALTETVNQLTTTTTLASNVNPALAGQNVTFTATVQAGAGNSVVGAVTFLDGSTTLGSTAVINNSAQLTIATLAPGSHSITAAYGGSTDFAASTSAALAETVNQSSTTTTLISNLNPAVFGQAVPFVATVQTASGGAATGTVTFYDGTTVLGITGVQINNSQHNLAQLTFSGFLGGTHTITAAYSGDANYTASTSGALTETITPASSSVTVGASPNPASFGQAVILTTTVVPSISSDQASGTVTFFDGPGSLGSANLSNNVAQISVASLALGSHSITASYAGDRNFGGSTSAALSEVVNPAATSAVVTSNADPAVINTNVTFMATVSSSSGGTQSGAVNFYLDGSSTAAATVNLSNGTATYATNSLSAGSHTVVAVFTSSNPGFVGSTSPAFTQYISDFTVSVSPSALTVSRSTSGTYVLTVTPVGQFSGTVLFSCGGVPGGTTCAISPTQVTLSGSGSAQATVTITAAQNASKGTHTLTFTGTSGGLNRKFTASLTIN